MAKVRRLGLMRCERLALEATRTRASAFTLLRVKSKRVSILQDSRTRRYKSFLVVCLSCWEHTQPVSESWIALRVLARRVKGTNLRLVRLFDSRERLAESKHFLRLSARAALHNATFCRNITETTRVIVFSLGSGNEPSPTRAEGPSAEPARRSSLFIRLASTRPVDIGGVRGVCERATLIIPSEGLEGCARWPLYRRALLLLDETSGDETRPRSQRAVRKVVKRAFRAS